MVKNTNLLTTFLLITLMWFVANVSYADNAMPIPRERQAELHNLLLQDCGSCHGMTMKGGLGPALTAEVLKTRSREMIETTILQGRPGTPMPPWKTILTKEEVRWIVDELYAGITL